MQHSVSYFTPVNYIMPSPDFMMHINRIVQPNIVGIYELLKTIEAYFTVFVVPSFIIQENHGTFAVMMSILVYNRA